MARRIAFLTLLTSIVLLAGVGVAWRISASAPPRADLVEADGDTSPAPPPSPAPTTPTTALTSGASTPDPMAARTFQVRPTPAPVRLSIPSIDVDVAVQAVGVRPDGGMEIPAATEAGWFAPGPHPTAPFGSAVMAAHIDYGGRRGAFFRLPGLQVGAQVTVWLADGSNHAYRVTERMQIPKKDLHTDEIFRRSGPPTLTLVTCGGAFNQSARHYSDNIIVRAVPA